jgi:cytidine deaminase
MDRRTALAAIGLAGTAMIGNERGPEAREDALRTLLPGAGAKSRELLTHALNNSRFDGTLSSEDATALAEFESTTVGAIMVELLPLAARFSRPPISDFHVGVVVRGASGRVYFGANIELPGQTLGASVHGEQSAASNAYMHREDSITALAVTAAPCGHCRQFLWEMCFGRDFQVLTRKHAPYSLKDLLPDAFGPANLGLDRGAFPVSQVALKLHAENAGPVAQAALEAAQMSYVPYTKAYAGVAIRTSRGTIYRGACIENAAYNPTLPPLQTALARLTTSGDDLGQIVEAALVEIPGMPVSHRKPTEAILAALAPSAMLLVLPAAVAR